MLKKKKKETIQKTNPLHEFQLISKFHADLSEKPIQRVQKKMYI